MTETKRIRWRETPGADPAWTGSVGTVDPSLFQIYAPDGFAPQWILIASFPGMEDKRSFADDPDELKAEAERWLEEFTSSLGAIFPEPTEHARQPLRMVGRQMQPRLCSCGEPWPCNGARNWHYGWAEASRDGDGNLILRYEPSGGLYRVLPIEET